MRIRLLGLLLVMLGAMVLAGCHTVEGMGKDIDAARQHIDGSPQSDNPYE